MTNTKPWKTISDLHPPLNTVLPGPCLDVTKEWRPEIGVLEVEGLTQDRDFLPDGGSNIIRLYRGGDGACWYLVHEPLAGTKDVQWLLYRIVEPTRAPEPA